jgi:TusA-related sulfurtransferase
MIEEKLDCRGLACPSPVLKTKEVLERGNVTRVSVLVDNSAAQENVSRFLSRMG